MTKLVIFMFVVLLVVGLALAQAPGIPGMPGGGGDGKNMKSFSKI